MRTHQFFQNPAGGMTLLGVALLGFALAEPAGASVNLIQNGNFATGVTPYPYVMYLTAYAPEHTTIPNWTVGYGANDAATNSGSVDWIQHIDGWIAPGGYSVDLDGITPGSISQTVNGLTKGAEYTFSFDLSGNPYANGGGAIKSLNVTATDTSLAAAGVAFTSTVSLGANYGAMVYVPESITFTAEGTSSLISFVSTDPADYSGGVVIADVSLIDPAPEPGFYGLLAVGLGGFAFFRYRRSRA